jgi:hypothetical protein
VTPDAPLESVVTDATIHEYLKCDELRILMSYIDETSVELPCMDEGVNNAGPIFLPTAKMQRGRTSPLYRLGTNSFRTPSWVDRILYQDLKDFQRTLDFDPFNRKDVGLQCIEYDRFDVGNMNLSDHAAVYGCFAFGSADPSRLFGDECPVV